MWLIEWKETTSAYLTLGSNNTGNREKIVKAANTDLK